MNIAFDSIDQLYYSVTRITTHHYTSKKLVDRKVLKIGTGFFYHNLSSHQLFLITNRHVIINEHEDYYPNVMRIKLHTNPSNLTQNSDYDIHLYDGGKKLWIESRQVGADVVEALFDFKPKYLLIDEIEKMRKDGRKMLLNLLSTGIVTSTKKSDNRTMKLNCWLFATCNDIEKLEKIEPSFLSRVQCLRIDAYSFEEFVSITVSRLKLEKIDTELAEYIANKVYEAGSSDVRDCVYIARMAKTQSDVDRRLEVLRNRRVRNDEG